MQLVNNAPQVNTWATTQHIDFKKAGPTGFDQGSIQAVYTDATTGAVTFGGVREVDQITFAALASTTDGDYFVINDYTGAAWAVALDTTGGAANTPTGAAWAAIPSANKVYTNVSTATTGSDVSGLVHTAINALTGFTSVITAATSTTHQNCTAIAAGVVSAPNVYSKAGAAGTGSITASVTTPGTASNVNTVTNTATITAHGQVTGSLGQMTTTGSLPTGLSTSTNYFLIVVDANTVKFASSLANAAAGTAIALSAPGYGTQTFTPTALSGAVCKLQVSNDGTNFSDISGKTVTIGSGGNTYWDLTDQYPNVIRVLFTPSAGSVKLTILPNFLKTLGGG